ncbi:MAG: hypothetical protein IKJ04_07020 [Clostridia bacterium]|nr:hypothetical protein [Clostridia bacterium]
MNMGSAYSVCIRFSGLTFRFTFPHYIDLSEEFTDLLCEDCHHPDEDVEIRLITEPLRPKAEPIKTHPSVIVYPTEGGELRVYPALTADDGCQVAFLLRSDRNNILYYPASRWEFFSSPLRLYHLIAGEQLLLRHNAFLLHSSVVKCQGKTLLFSGPSGAGKSTQADLWAKYAGAEVLNGDRCVVMKRDGTFLGGGSPWCGTSGIRKKDQAPIAGVFLVNQSTENSVVPLGIEAFTPLFSQITLNSWDVDFMSEVSQMLADLITEVPVCRLNCRPDSEAVKTVYNFLFGRDV